jgi:hypothetical protein
MSLDKYKLKIKKNSDEIDDESPQYSLTYRSGSKDAAGISHEILSALIGENDVIIEINSDMSGPGINKTDPVAEFIEKTGACNLSYRMRNIQSERNRTVFGFTLDIKKKKQAREALIYIPNAVWHHPAFRNYLPLNGARYYITSERDNVAGFLEEIEKMSLFDKASVSKAVIFDLAICGQMGISSTHLSMDEIEGMLGL